MNETPAKGRVTIVDLAGLIEQLGAVQHEQARLLHDVDTRLTALERRSAHEVQVLQEAIRVQPAPTLTHWPFWLASLLAALTIILLLWAVARW
jgi:hypothetical protein